jgi:hypothetical protein
VVLGVLPTWNVGFEVGFFVGHLVDGLFVGQLVDGFFVGHLVDGFHVGVVLGVLPTW